MGGGWVAVTVGMCSMMMVGRFVESAVLQVCITRRMSLPTMIHLYSGMVFNKLCVIDIGGKTLQPGIYDTVMLS